MAINNKMIYGDFDQKRTRHFCICSCAENIEVPIVGTSPCNDYFTEYVTARDAREAGWRRTNHIKFCPPDEDYRWVCPDCAKDFDWDLHTRIIPDNYKRILNDHSDRKYHNG